MGVQVKTFAKRSGNFRQLSERYQRLVLNKMIDKTLDASPVDTAAYVDSFGFNNPQGFSSKERFRKRPGPTVDPVSARQRNKARLMSEVAAIDLSGPVVFGNGAPHAPIVERDSSPFSAARREFRNFSRQALQEVKSGGL